VSTDPDYAPLSYSWSFGDGGTASGVNPSHAYAKAGTYTVTLMVTDRDSEVKSTTQQVTVVNGPVASFTFSPNQPLEKTAVAFDGNGSFDPVAGANITSYAWSFGDGGNATGATPSHIYATYGTYTATLTLTDDGRGFYERAKLAIEAGVEVVNVYGPASWHGYRPTDAELGAYYEEVLAAIRHPVALAPNPISVPLTREHRAQDRPPALACRLDCREPLAGFLRRESLNQGCQVRLCRRVHVVFLLDSPNCRRTESRSA